MSVTFHNLTSSPRRSTSRSFESRCRCWTSSAAAAESLLAPIAGKNPSLKQPLDTTEPKLAGGPVGVGEGSGLHLDPFGVGAPAESAPLGG
jgi:hypothetical protein